VAVWLARPAKPGLLEAMGVHGEHRRHGYGKAISFDAAAALQELRSSGAIVCTPSSNVGAVATYESAGFLQLPEIRTKTGTPRRCGNRNTPSQKSNTDQQMSLRNRWSSRTGSRIASGSWSRCHRHSSCRARSASPAGAAARAALIA
jgi:hypothetical protein